MKFKLLFLIPIVMFFVAIITSIIAFNRTEILEEGYIYSSSEEKIIVYEGDYYAILGNLGEEDYSVTINPMDEYIQLTIYNEEEVITKDYKVEILDENNVHVNSFLIDYLENEKNIIDELDSYIFTTNFKENEQVNLVITTLPDNIDEETIDIALVHISEPDLNMKSLMESVAFTTGVFGVLSLFTIFIYVYVKKY